MNNRKYDVFRFLMKNATYWKPESQGVFHVCPDSGTYWNLHILHKATSEEQILFAFVDGNTEGLLITDQRIVKDRYSVEWNNLAYFKIQGNYILPINNDDTASCRFSIPYFLLGINNIQAAEECVSILIKVLKDEAMSLVECNEKVANNDQDAVNLCFSCIDMFPKNAAIYYGLVGKYYFQNSQYQRTIETCLRGLQEELQTNQSYAMLCFQLSKAAQAVNDWTSVRRYTLAAYDRIPSNAVTKEGTSTKNFCYEMFLNANQNFLDNLENIPYQDRKVIIIVDHYSYNLFNKINQLEYSESKSLSFPFGHPIKNEIYVGHPLIPNKYIPFESYQLEFVEDKVREFCQLAQCLGATEISIDCINSSSSDGDVTGKKEVSVNIDHWAANGSGSRNRDYNRHMIEELSRSISLHQTFEPHNKPTVPDGLVWYDNEPSWQRLVSQRINGGLTSHQERIETKKSQMIEGREMTEIKAEVKSLFLDMSVNFDTTEEQKFSTQENAVLSINVKFAPLSQLNGFPQNNNQVLPPSPKASFTTDEKEYLEEVKECLADGEIGPRERRLLDKIRSKLGISAARASELEASLSTPKLTEDEQEYLKEYKECAIDGIVSDKERRLLDKVRKMLGISEERAAEIEKLIK
ncbi:MAG: hypothetical protein KBT20_01265 [Bacteroidales bacterium]|nr:hypothetical protein [Candidatus Liminaster caballi]